MTTINDLYNEFVAACGSNAPRRTRDEVQAKFHRLGYHNYEREGEEFIRRALNDCNNPWPWGGRWREAGQAVRKREVHSIQMTAEEWETVETAAKIDQPPPGAGSREGTAQAWCRRVLLREARRLIDDGDLWHVTSVRAGAVYGHEESRCDECGCAIAEKMIGTVADHPGVRAGDGLRLSDGWVREDDHWIDPASREAERAGKEG